jgi:alpha-ketoglutarate-dependent taurine dioxygenase/4-hydroxybenzoate polyprenyltransferase
MKLIETQPFGLIVELSGSFDQIEPSQLQEWLAQYRVVVVRGADPIARNRLPLLARTLGPIQAWSFGAINELKQDPEAKNYLFTNGAVPLHWDGAFKKEVPRYLFFHCVKAPDPEAGGQTIFVDAAAPLATATTEQQMRWKDLRFRYETEKVVHYGGCFEADLVSQHPYNKEAVLRFAEPVTDLNPVTVTAVGTASQESDELIAELRERLSSEEFCLEHTWRSGDVVIADNHAVLHGRRAFLKDAPRHLRRVNLLDPERKPWQFLVDSLRIRRLEFMVAEIPILLIPALLLSPPAVLGSAKFLEGTLLFFLLFHFGDMINCYADRELDSVYKTKLSEAVYGLGLGNVRGQMIATVLLALGLASHLSWSLSRWWILALVVIGLVLGAQYSVGLRLKARGVWQVPTLWAVIFFGPMLMIGALLQSTLPPLLLIVAAFYGALQVGVVLVNTAEDYREDIDCGLRTTAVMLGPQRCIALAASLVAIGGGMLLGLAITAAAAQQALMPWLGAAVFSVGWLWALKRIGGLALRLKRLDESLGLVEIKAAGRLIPVWITIVGWSALAVTLSLGPVLGAQP